MRAEIPGESGGSLVVSARVQTHCDRERVSWSGRRQRLSSAGNDHGQLPRQARRVDAGRGCHPVCANRDERRSAPDCLLSRSCGASLPGIDGPRGLYDPVRGKRRRCHRCRCEDNGRCRGLSECGRQAPFLLHGLRRDKDVLLGAERDLLPRPVRPLGADRHRSRLERSIDLWLPEQPEHYHLGHRLGGGHPAPRSR